MTEETRSGGNEILMKEGVTLRFISAVYRKLTRIFWLLSTSFLILATIFFVHLFLSASLEAVSPREEMYYSDYGRCIEIEYSNHMNNAAVFGCATAVSNYMWDEIYRKIGYLTSEKIDRIDREHLIESVSKSQYAWEEYMEYECYVKTRYIGDPMQAYCPMRMLQERNEELADLLSHVNWEYQAQEMGQVIK
jgi:hypothetical protein